MVNVYNYKPRSLLETASNLKKYIKEKASQVFGSAFDKEYNLNISAVDRYMKNADIVLNAIKEGKLEKIVEAVSGKSETKGEERNKRPRKKPGPRSKLTYEIWMIESIKNRLSDEEILSRYRTTKKQIGGFKGAYKKHIK